MWGDPLPGTDLKTFVPNFHGKEKVKRREEGPALGRLTMRGPLRKNNTTQVEKISEKLKTGTQSS